MGSESVARHTTVTSRNGCLKTWSKSRGTHEIALNIGDWYDVRHGRLFITPDGIAKEREDLVSQRLSGPSYKLCITHWIAFVFDYPMALPRHHNNLIFRTNLSRTYEHLCQCVTPVHASMGLANATSTMSSRYSASTLHVDDNAVFGYLKVGVGLV